MLLTLRFLAAIYGDLIMDDIVYGYQMASMLSVGYSDSSAHLPYTSFENPQSRWFNSMMDWNDITLPRDNSSFITLMPLLNVVYDNNHECVMLLNERPNVLMKHLMWTGAVIANARAVSFFCSSMTRDAYITAHRGEQVDDSQHMMAY